MTFIGWFVVIQVVLIFTKLIIQTNIDKESGLTFIDVLFQWNINIFHFLPMSCKNKQHKIACKIANIAIILFYANFVILFILFKLYPDSFRTHKT